MKDTSSMFYDFAECGDRYKAAWKFFKSPSKIMQMFPPVCVGCPKLLVIDFLLLNNGEDGACYGLRPCCPRPTPHSFHGSQYSTVRIYVRTRTVTSKLQACSHLNDTSYICSTAALAVRFVGCAGTSTRIMQLKEEPVFTQ